MALGPVYLLCSMHLQKKSAKERSALGTFLVDVEDGVCNIFPERDGDNRV
jgi:hypothetical protein